MHQLARTRAEEEERIATVLQQRSLSSQRSAKELQQLRNESAELRDLQANLTHCCLIWIQQLQNTEPTLYDSNHFKDYVQCPGQNQDCKGGDGQSYAAPGAADNAGEGARI